MSDEVKSQIAKEQVAFLNIFGARLWHDLHNSKTFIDLLREKITRKLLKVKVKIEFKINLQILFLFLRLFSYSKISILSSCISWSAENIYKIKIRFLPFKGLWFFVKLQNSEKKLNHLKLGNFLTFAFEFY